jgi:hypothetical protein
MNYTFCFFKHLQKGRLLFAAVTIFAIATMGIQNAHAVVNWRNVGVYYENFDSLTNVEGIDSLWLDEVTLGDWYANKLTIRGDRGVVSQSKLMSYGSFGSTDRALGSHINSGVPLTNSFGLKLFNDSVDDIESFTVRYTGEQWRAKFHSGTSAERIRFTYATGNILLGLNLGSYSLAPNLDFISPNISNVGMVNGNLYENSETITFTVTGINWQQGQYLMLRFEDFTEKTGADNDGLAVDDFYFTTSENLDEFNVAHTGVNFESVPEPGTIGLFGVAAVAALIAAKRRKMRAA